MKHPMRRYLGGRVVGGCVVACAPLPAGFVSPQHRAVMRRVRGGGFRERNVVGRAPDVGIRALLGPGTGGLGGKVT